MRLGGEPIEAVLLDVGGPIYDDECFAQALLVALEQLAGPIDASEFRAVYDDQRQRQAGSLRRAIMNRFMPDGGLDTFTRLAEDHWEYSPEALYPDVLPVLARLRDRYRIGIVANQRGLVRQALTRDGIDPYIDAWALSEDVGAEKPSPEIFTYALQQVAVSAGRAVHVGNRLDTDIRGAHAAGLRSVWMLRGEAAPAPTLTQMAEPDAVITSLHDLPSALQRLQETHS